MSTAALSDYLENKLLDHLVKATAYTPAATLYVGLFTSDPGESGVTGELTIGTGAYARASVTNNNVNFPQCPATGTPIKTNGTVIQFPTASANWGTVTHWAIYDAASTGTNMLAHGALAVQRNIVAGDSPKIAVGAFTFQFTNATSGGLTEYAQRKLLDHVFGGPTYTSPATVYVGLSTAISGETLSEWTESSYDRKAIAFSSASAGVSANSGTVTFTTNVVDGAANLNSFGIWDDVNTGNLLLAGPVSTARTVQIGDTANFTAGTFNATLQ